MSKETQQNGSGKDKFKAEESLAVKITRQAKERLAREQSMHDVIVSMAEKLGEIGLEPKIWSDYVDFDRLSHSEIVKVMLAFPGKWNKSLNTGQCNIGDPRIDYELNCHGYKIRCWAGEPPPACKLEEYQAVEPAQPERIVTRRRLVCPKVTEMIDVVVS